MRLLKTTGVAAMEFPLLKSLSEVQTQLKSLLDELGLKAKLAKNYGANIIQFANGDGTLLSPVFVKLQDNVIAGYSCTRFERRQIGDTGWTHDVCEIGDWYGIDTEAADEAFFQELREVIQENIVLKAGGGHPNHTNDENFYRAFQEINDCLWRDNEQAEIKCFRDANGVESYEFNLFELDWRISFEGEKAVLRSDDNIIGAVRASGEDLIRKKLSAELKRSRPDPFKI
jgi:hypothetical protein